MFNDFSIRFFSGTEGRAGMAAIVFDETVNGDETKFLVDIGERLSANLAPYALPQFVRLCKQVDRTGSCVYRCVKM